MILKKQKKVKIIYFLLNVHFFIRKMYFDPFKKHLLHKRFLKTAKTIIKCIIHLAFFLKYTCMHSKVYRRIISHSDFLNN